MRWFFPSWNGDLRVESHETDPKKSRLTIIEPTLREQEVLKQLGVFFKKKGWYDTDVLWKDDTKSKQETLILEVALKKVAPVLVKHLKPGKQTLSAVIVKGGKIETIEGSDVGLVEFAEKAEEKGATAAATVKRATPSCPQCVPGAIGPANEVLQSFLDEEQHEEWSKHRALVAIGGITGTRYLLAHRNSKAAQKIGRICYDLDSQSVVHFHDRTVPPEEEVLAAKLILEHREPWLRNEATCLGGAYGEIFKNPFGDGLDGVMDASITAQFGLWSQVALGMTGKHVG